MADPVSRPAEVAVIIAAYNVERYIERAVRSALNQTGVAVEVIVVNDRSTDGTLAALAGIADPRLRLLDLPVNGGPSTARNAGFAAATAPWLAVLDGDDALEPARLARCLTLAKQQQADIVVDNLTIRREADGVCRPMYSPAALGDSPLTLAAFINGNTEFLGGTSLGYLKPVFSAAFLRRHGLAYDPAVMIGEDYLLLAGALACGAVCAIEPTAGYLYTVRAGSISHRLALADIARIAAGDRRFVARYRLDPAAQRAQIRRTAKLADAAAFTQLVDALKARDIKRAVKAVLNRPLALLPLWQPVRARLPRLRRQV